MTDTTIFIIGVIVVAITLSGFVFTVLEMRRLHGRAVAPARSDSLAGAVVRDREVPS